MPTRRPMPAPRFSRCERTRSAADSVNSIAIPRRPLFIGKSRLRRFFGHQLRFRWQKTSFLPAAQQGEMQARHVPMCGRNASMRGWRPALRILTSTPAGDGFRMPAEYERHSGCWMLWPERPDNWRGRAKPAQAAFAAVAAAIVQGEPVTVGASAAQFQNARARLPPQVRVVEITSNDAWIRDCGPTFVIDAKGRRRGIDWSFNAWGGLHGGLYFPWDRDDEVAQKVLEFEGSDRYPTSFVLEGGAIHVDGRGTCLTTEECLLNPNRNGAVSRTDVESMLQRYLGVTTVIWLGQGVHLDETGGHIDELACFTSPGQVALTWTDDRG